MQESKQIAGKVVFLIDFYRTTYQIYPVPWHLNRNVRNHIFWHVRLKETQITKTRLFKYIENFTDKN